MGPAIVMKVKQFNFPFLVTLVLGVFAVLFAFTTSPRVTPELQNIYFNLKMLYAVLGFSFAVYFYYKDGSDAIYAFFMAMLASYCLVFMWFAPLYEVAYLEVAIAASFFKLRLRWIFPTIFGLCLLGILFTYYQQDKMGWILPPIIRADWYATIVIFFILTWSIHQFALGAHLKEKERLSRFGVVGKEATRLTHDIKGLLSSPILTLDALRSQQQFFSPEEFEKQLVLLAEDLKNVSGMIKSIHRLVHIEGQACPVEIVQILQAPLIVLERRLRDVKITLPENKVVMANPDRLHSIFFNLFLNSIEAFEKKKITKPCIEIFWEGKCLVIRDNGGSLQKNNMTEEQHTELGTNLGLTLVKIDVERIGAKLSSNSLDQSTETRITFKQKMLAT